MESASLPASLEGDFAWQRVGLVTSTPSDLAVVPAASGAWVAITDHGEVWLTVDAGGTFNRILGSATAETEPRRRIEARIQELVDELAAALAGAASFDPTAVDASAAEVLEREIGALQDQLDELGRDDAGTVVADRSLRPRIWATEDAIFAGRADGLWRTEDLGGTWRQVMDVPTHGLARVPGRTLWAAGTDDGMRFSVDGRSWLDPEDGTEGLAVFDVVPGHDGVWAGTADGLWFAADAQSWQKVGGTDSVLRVRPDPDWVRGAWVATPSGVLRTDDGGGTLRSGLGAQVPGVSSLLWLGPGRLLAVGSDGLWESLDAGTTWSARSNGLTDSDTRAVAQDGTTLLLASADGIYRLVEGSGAVPAAPQLPSLALEPLIEAATHRRELVQRTGNRSAATVLPVLHVDGDWAQVSALDWALLTGTTRTGGAAWGVSMSLSWAPGDQASLDEALLPIEARWLTDEGAMSTAFAAAESRDASRYRIALSQQVADLYFARAELVAAASVHTSVGEAVKTRLRIEEIDARLDSLTDGAVSRLSQDPTRENP